MVQISLNLLALLSHTLNTRVVSAFVCIDFLLGGILCVFSTFLRRPVVLTVGVGKRQKQGGPSAILSAPQLLAHHTECVTM